MFYATIVNMEQTPEKIGFKVRESKANTERKLKAVNSDVKRVKLIWEARKKHKGKTGTWLLATDRGAVA